MATIAKISIGKNVIFDDQTIAYFENGKFDFDFGFSEAQVFDIIHNIGAKIPVMVDDCLHSFLDIKI